MTSTVLEAAPLTNALHAWLEGLALRPVGKLQSPPNRPFPYHVLYSVPGGGYDGPPLSGPDEDATVVYQVNTVALDPDAAGDNADHVRRLMLGRVPATGAFEVPAPSVDGWRIIDRRPDGGTPGAEYSGAPPKRVFTIAERFVLVVTPNP